MLTVKMSNNISKGDILADTNIDDNQIFLSYTTALDSTMNFSDKELLADEAEYIIIGTVTSVDGGINYNPVQKCYTMIQTIGKLKVDKVLKGDIKDKQILFVRNGGTIKLSEYEKSLTKEYIEYIGLDKMTEKEKENQYVSDTIQGNVQIEKGKTYLMYLNYNTDYGRYNIKYYEYGLKEVDASSLSSDANITNSDTETLTSNEYKAIKVKNNTNGKYEILDSIIPDKVKKIK